MRIIYSLIIGGLMVWLGRIYMQRREGHKGIMGMINRQAARMMGRKMMRHLT